jgi:glycosyltransferase involved in cell wall biosynthesis
MKILYVCSTDLSGEYGSLGSVRHIMEVCENLHQLGNRIKLIVPNYAIYPHDTPIDTVYVPLVKVRFLRTLIYELLAPFFLMAYLLFWKPDVVYWRQAYLTIFPVLLSRLFRKKILTEVNGLTIDEVESELVGKCRKGIILGFEKFNYHGSSHLICVAPKIKERIIEHYHLVPSKVSVVLNGVNSKRMPVINPHKAKEKVGLNPAFKVIGFVGHFFPWDGIEYLIEAAPKIIQENGNVRFLIVGHGKWGDHLPKLVSQNKLTEYFIFTGKVPWEKLYLYVNAFDVATAPYSKSINSQSGRSSLKILEYFACNKPVVASNTVVIPEIVDINVKRLGKTVKPENSEELAIGILSFLKNGENLINIGNRGRAYVQKERSWEVVARNTLNIINTMVSPNK